MPRDQVGAVSLSPYRGDALAVVTHQVCPHCAITENDFLISAGATVRHLLTRRFPAFDGSIERAQVPGALADWLLRRPRHGACTLRLMPSARAAVSVPCGDLGEVNADGIVLWTNQDQLLVDPRTGAVRSRLPAGINQVPVGRGHAIRGPTQGKGTLSLINLASGEHRTLGWPSPLHFGYMLFPDPAAPLVAIEFADPAYPDYTSPTSTTTIGQVADLWVLNLHTGRLAHVPGFPILEGLKVSSVAWTADGRLVVAAKGGRLRAIRQPRRDRRLAPRANRSSRRTATTARRLQPDRAPLPLTTRGYLHSGIIVASAPSTPSHELGTAALGRRRAGPVALASRSGLRPSCRSGVPERPFASSASPERRSTNRSPLDRCRDPLNEELESVDHIRAG